MSEHEYVDAHGNEYDTFTHADGNSETFVHGADGSEYQVDTDAYGNSHVVGEDGHGHAISGDVDSRGNVLDAHESDSHGNRIDMAENRDGTYNVHGHTAAGADVYESHVDPYAK